MEDIKSIVGQNLNAIRKERNLTLQDLSNLTGVSKSMLGEIERGVTNPTVTVLWKIANGIKVAFGTLVKEKKPPVSVIYNKSLNPILGTELYNSYTLFEYDDEKNFEIYLNEYDPGSIHESESHYKGVEEYTLIASGSLKVRIKDDIYELSQGDSIKFEADHPHAYINESNEPAKVFMILYYNK